MDIGNGRYETPGPTVTLAQGPKHCSSQVPIEVIKEKHYQEEIATILNTKAR